MQNSFSSLSVAVEALQKEGYTTDFNLVEKGIECKAYRTQWEAGELEVVKFYRFEGITDPGDSTILYVIETKDGTKGLLVDTYGAASGQVSSEMIQKLNMHHDE